MIADPKKQVAFPDTEMNWICLYRLIRICRYWLHFVLQAVQ